MITQVAGSDRDGIRILYKDFKSTHTMNFNTSSFCESEMNYGNVSLLKSGS